MLNSFDTKTTISIKEKDYQYYSLKILEAAFPNINKLPFSLKILLENMLRFEDGKTVTREDISAFSEWLEHKSSTREIAFRPTRVLMQDFTGVPAVVDLATKSEAKRS